MHIMDGVLGTRDTGTCFLAVLLFTIFNMDLYSSLRLYTEPTCYLENLWLFSPDPQLPSSSSSVRSAKLCDTC